MELPSRQPGDQLLRAGELASLRQRLSRIAPQHDLASVVVCAFDQRTQMLPYSFSSVRIAPAGVRAVGSALVDAGMTKTRIVLQQWNPRFSPSQARLDGRMPDLLMISSMQIHAGAMEKLLRDVCTLPPSQRPLVVVGGPKIIYEPWDAFSPDPKDPWGADVAVTGEEFALLSLLEILLAFRSGREHLRSAFVRAREAGALDQLAGLVYPIHGPDGVARELVDTGVGRLLGDLDELPHPVLGFGLLEAPSRRATLGSRPLEPHKVRRHSPIGTVVVTTGCKFTCPYCPIPAYNQRQLRGKSGPRVADEMKRIHETYGINFFFGTDDNFFADRRRALEICQSLADAKVDSVPLHRRIHWGTEATIHDTLAMSDDLKLVRKAGVFCLWIGVEDMTATLVRKGQGGNLTLDALSLLQKHGITTVPMLMHHDDQPLVSRRGNYGLLNQVRTLRKAGAVDEQTLIITPAPGSKLYEQTFEAGLVIESAGGTKVQSHMLDGNYVVASKSRRPWRMQFNIMAALLFLYNPPRLLGALISPKSSRYLHDASIQIVGMWGLVLTLPRMLAWTLRLMTGKIVRCTQPPAARIPMRSVEGGRADHALPDQQPQGQWANAPAKQAQADPVAHK